MIVLDESGKQIGKTFPKRAKGLVKNGRARFIDETTICLACPPENEFSEDIEMNTDIKNEQTPTAEEETKTAKTVAQPPETVEVKLMRYQNGMENWHGEVQILFCPQYENGKNVVPLYSKDVQFTIFITDCYDKTRVIKLYPSTIYNEGAVRGLAIIRFEPCLAEGENRFVPEKGKSYWMSFSAVGTDGKVYVSDENEMRLNAEPMINGKSKGGNEGKTVNSHIYVNGVPVDFSDLSKLSELSKLTELSKLSELSKTFGAQNNVSQKQERPASDELSPLVILQKIDELEKSFTERLKTVIDSIVSPEDVDDASYEDYLDAVKSVTVQLNDAHTQSLQIYTKLLDKLTDRPVKSPQEKYLEETTAYIKTLPVEKQPALLNTLLWAYAEKTRGDTTARFADGKDDKDDEE